MQFINLTLLLLAFPGPFLIAQELPLRPLALCLTSISLSLPLIPNVQIVLRKNTLAGLATRQGLEGFNGCDDGRFTTRYATIQELQGVTKRIL